MKKLTALLVLNVGLLSFGLLNVAHAAGDAKVGATKSASCGACHGADGNSMVPNFPKLAGQSEKYLVKQMVDIKNGSRQVVEMTGLMDGLSDQDISDISAYFASKTAQLSGSEDDKVQLALGQRIYRAGNHETGVSSCSGCHSPTGQGNYLAGYPTLAGQHPAYIVKQLKDFRNEIRTNDGETAVMRGVAAHMSDKEIEAVANFIAGLH